MAFHLLWVLAQLLAGERLLVQLPAVQAVQRVVPEVLLVVLAEVLEEAPVEAPEEAPVEVLVELVEQLAVALGALAAQVLQGRPQQLQLPSCHREILQLKLHSK